MSKKNKRKQADEAVRTAMPDALAVLTKHRDRPANARHYDWQKTTQSVVVLGAMLQKIDMDSADEVLPEVDAVLSRLRFEVDQLRTHLGYRAGERAMFLEVTLDWS